MKYLATLLLAFAIVLGAHVAAQGSGFSGGKAVVSYPQTIPNGLGAVAQLVGPTDQSMLIQSGTGESLTLASASGQVINFKAGGTTNSFVDAAGNVCPNTASSAFLGKAADGWGKLYMDYTNTGTVGAVTINKPCGRVNLAASGTTLVVTNSLVTAASHIFVTPSAGSTSATLNALPAAGSFTITNGTPQGGQFAIDFLVVNAD